ncbi:MAG: aminodeoxychorismate synthase component I [Kaiparowitsia implicata GSE-PSE-MK54-09C]|nr:aminodeoxychorismate synthase component I [Kaiparowitsia implicata GSE-PSE-MK54-09C]
MAAPSVILYDTQRQCWLRFQQPRQMCVAFCIDGVLPMLTEVQARVADGYYAAGFVSYEAAPAFDSALTVRTEAGAFPLLWFGIFDAPAVMDDGALLCQTNSQHGLPGLAPPEPSLHWQPTVSRADYDRAIAAIKTAIRQGDTYQVNYTFRLRAPFAGDPWGLFQRMIAAQGAGYGAFVQGISAVGQSEERFCLCSASPELFFQQHGVDLVSRPMKGTAARGVQPQPDRQQAQWLHASAKNRAENVMIVDMMRNDLNRIARHGSVVVPQLFEVEQYPTLWQLTSTVRCETDAGLVDLFRALFPAASITGAPKARTMQIIQRLETTPRHIYTGTIGYLSPHGTAQFNVAIRTVLCDRQQNLAEYGIGSGIVWDSDTRAEYEECLTKAKIVF